MNSQDHPSRFSADSASRAISRRTALRYGLLSAAGLMFANRLTPRLFAAAPAPSTPSVPKSGPRAKAVIEVWLWGGPSHLDTFDPKPEAGYDYCGPFSHPIATNVSGIRICELLPLLAKQADKYSLIRSLTHGNNAHETAAYMVQTGRSAGGRYVYPSMGAVISLFKGYDAGYRSLIPPYIVLTTPQGRFSEAGFLGARYKPFATGGDPAKTPFVVDGIVAPGLTPQRQQGRRDLLDKLDTLSHALPSSPDLIAATASERDAYDLILGSAGKIFDLGTETDAVRNNYGRNTFGQSCLMARRLVEQGVPFVTINYPGWDTHKQNFQAMRRLLPELDKGLSTLLQDLSERGLLEQTIVWCLGEFGRTPKVMWEAPWNGGRGHWGSAFSALVAGGGFKGGRVVGATDEYGEVVAERPVYPADLIASMYELLGIDAHARLPNPEGLPIEAVPTPDEGVKMTGRLTEIM